MERIDTIRWPNGDLEATFRDDQAGKHLRIRITSEGMIMDAYSIDEDGNDFIIGALGRIANEWWEYLEGSGG